MKYLLDTHVIMWNALTPQKLSAAAKQIITDVSAEKFVSIASVWEFEIKRSLGKLDFDHGLDGFLYMIEENGFELLGIEKEYVKQLSLLSAYHTDPFDRMLIATALSEKLTLLTSDSKIQKYEVPQIW